MSRVMTFGDLNRRRQQSHALRKAAFGVSPYVRNSGLFLAATEIAQYGSDKVPFATALMIIMQTIIFTQNWIHDTSSVCLSTEKVLKGRSIKSFVMSNFVHDSEGKAAYNMISFLLKGLYLEPVYGPYNFTLLIGLLTLMCSATHVALGFLLSEVVSKSYCSECALGFSTVLFALKVICVNERGDSPQYIEGLPVPTKFAVWVELAIVQFLIPNSSLVGNVSGVIIGYLYCNTNLGERIEDWMKSVTRTRISHRAGYLRRNVIRMF